MGKRGWASKRNSEEWLVREEKAQETVVFSVSFIEKKLITSVKCFWWVNQNKNLEWIIGFNRVKVRGDHEKSHLYGVKRLRKLDSREDERRASLGHRGVREVRVPFWSNFISKCIFDTHLRCQVGSWINTLRDSGMVGIHI